MDRFLVDYTIFILLFQFDFPFVEVLRVKEVRFRLRLPTGFKYNDSNFNEIDYEIERRKNLLDSASKSKTEILEINELSDSDDEDDLSKSSSSTAKTVQSSSATTKSKPPFKKSQSVQQFSSKSLLKRTNTETSIKLHNTGDSEDSDSDDDDDDDSDNSGEIVVRFLAYLCLLLFVMVHKKIFHKFQFS